MAMKLAQSSFRDRTQEFQSIVDRLKKSLTSGSGTDGPSSSSESDELRSNVVIQSEFNRRASKIGYGIHQTSQKLAKLGKCKYKLKRQRLMACCRLVFCIKCRNDFPLFNTRF